MTTLVKLFIKVLLPFYQKRTEVDFTEKSKQDPTCLIFCSPFVVDKVQTKILSLYFNVPIKSPNKRQHTLKGNFTNSTVWNTGESGDIYPSP